MDTSTSTPASARSASRNSLYTDVRPDPSGNLSDNWVESFVKPALSGDLRAREERALRRSQRGRRAHLRGPAAAGRRARPRPSGRGSLPGLAFGHVVGKTENVLDFTRGPRPVQDRPRHAPVGRRRRRRAAAAGSGATRARPGSSPTIAPVQAEEPHHRGLLPRPGRGPRKPRRGTRLWGGNYELALGEANTLGASYLHFYADPATPDRDGLNVFNLRAYLAPIQQLPDLSFEAEYAQEDNGDLLSSTAWNVLAAYQLSKVGWKPKLSYRYAFFQGDDPATTKNEGFDRSDPRLLRLGHLVAGRDRRRVLPVQLQPHLAPGAAAPDAQRVDRDRG